MKTVGFKLYYLGLMQQFEAYLNPNKIYLHHIDKTILRSNLTREIEDREEEYINNFI